MQYCNGGTLHDFLQIRNGKLQPAIIKEIMWKIIHGYTKGIYENKIVHMNLNLKNIYIHFVGANLYDIEPKKKREWLIKKELKKNTFDIKISGFYCS